MTPQRIGGQTISLLMAMTAQVSKLTCVEGQDTHSVLTLKQGQPGREELLYHHPLVFSWYSVHKAP